VHDIVPNEPGAVDFVSELRSAPVAERLEPTEQLLDGEHCPVVPEAKLLRALREEDLGAIPLSAPVTKELVQAFLLRCERERVVEKGATNALELGEAGKCLRLVVHSAKHIRRSDDPSDLVRKPVEVLVDPLLRAQVSRRCCKIYRLPPCNKIAKILPLDEGAEHMEELEHSNATTALADGRLRAAIIGQALECGEEARLRLRPGNTTPLAGKRGKDHTVPGARSRLRVVQRLALSRPQFLG
jgi:hypothetical protein